MADTFWQALGNTIQRAVNLRVITILGDAEITGQLESLEVKIPNTGTKSLVTDINIVAGDITTTISPDLEGDTYTNLRASHDASVKDAREILRNNVELLTKLFNELKGDVNKVPPPSNAPPGPGTQNG